MEFKEIKIVRLKKEKIKAPSNDGSPRSALYAIPFELSDTPPQERINLFINNWNNPPSYSSMHRPRIAEVYSNELILNGTTIEEYEKYHHKTLKLVLNKVNQEIKDYFNKINAEEEKERKEKILKQEELNKKLDDKVDKLDFN